MSIKEKIKKLFKLETYINLNVLKEKVIEDMWPHFCTMENVDMYVGKGEACNWCGEKEKEFLLSERDRLTKESARQETEQLIIMEMELIDEENAPEHSGGRG